MKPVMDRDRLVHTVGFACGSTRPLATRIWHGIRSRLRRREWPTALALTFWTGSVARQWSASEGAEDPRFSHSRIRENPDGDRNHDISHSFASSAPALGHSLTLIDELLGYRQLQTTAPYSHYVRHSLKAAVEESADSTLAYVTPPPENHAAT